MGMYLSGSRRGAGPRAAFVTLFTCLVVILIAGCGGDSSADESTVQMQIEEARREGAAAAHRRERMVELQRRVTRLERQARRSPGTKPGATVATAPRAVAQADVDDSTILRMFHAPSGNVSCALLTDGATCSVASVNKTFVLENGVTAWSEPGTHLSRGSGEYVPFGSTVSAGQVTCTVPASNEPRGIVCTDSTGNHGFEASRIESRQSTF
jgi:hypothetical protein